MRHIILGTAGHIDHGKSSLVKALTGTDPDRLKEEKERGITIDIGFADLAYPADDLVVGIVDVPGHERLINNMLAGAGGIDLVLLVIAADEGIMPQSREHLAICNLLRIKSGLVVITKSDLVEEEWLDLVRDEVHNFVKGSFLENAPIIAVSSKTGDNLELLKKEIRERALAVEPKKTGGLFRLPIDRVFTLKGFGTVITGTAVSGSISLDSPIEIIPKNISTKVRGLHSHGRVIERAYAGQRVAINLQGVDKDQLTRGDVAVTPSGFIPARSIDAYLELLDGAPIVKTKSLVHFFIGTSETIARVVLYEQEEVKAGGACYCQFRLQDPVVAASGDRYIIRRFSPLETLGGGEVLDPLPGKRRRRDGINDLEVLRQGGLDEKISMKVQKAGRAGLAAEILRGWLSAELRSVEDSIARLKQRGVIKQYEQLLLHGNVFTAMKQDIVKILHEFHMHNPLKQGMPKEEIRGQCNISQELFQGILSDIPEVVIDKNLARLKAFKIALSSTEEATRSKIIGLLEQGGFQPMTKAELGTMLHLDTKHLADILNLLVKEKTLVRISDSLYISESSYSKMMALLKDFFSKKAEMTVAEFRDLLNTSRKYALPFVEFLDAQKITIRTGDVRKLMGKNL